jgi:hypothetical protein
MARITVDCARYPSGIKSLTNRGLSDVTSKPHRVSEQPQIHARVHTYNLTFSIDEIRLLAQAAELIER